MNVAHGGLDELSIPVDQVLGMTVCAWDYQFALTLSVHVGHLKHCH